MDFILQIWASFKSCVPVSFYDQSMHIVLEWGIQACLTSMSFVLLSGIISGVCKNTQIVRVPLFKAVPYWICFLCGKILWTKFFCLLNATTFREWEIIYAWVSSLDCMIKVSFIPHRVPQFFQSTIPTSQGKILNFSFILSISKY